MPQLRTVVHVIAGIIFLVQARQSLHKYFQYPVVTQNSLADINTIEKATIQVCLDGSFQYGKAAEFGYSLRSKYLAGMIPNSTTPTWKGNAGNSTIQEIEDYIFRKDFRKVKINIPNEFIYKFGKGFCLQTQEIDQDIFISSKEVDLNVYIIHDSTDSQLIKEKNPQSFTKLNKISSTMFDYKIYELSYEVLDETIHDGNSCVDYRKQDQSYGECNYNALKHLIYSNYGCYPHWMKTNERKQCEVHVPSKSMDSATYLQIWKNLDTVTDRIRIDIMDQCKEPCYQVKVNLKEKANIKATFIQKAELKIIDNAKTVPILKAVNSYDFFTLTVELGSALGLWLGNVLHIHIHNTFLTSFQCKQDFI